LADGLLTPPAGMEDTFDKWLVDRWALKITGGFCTVLLSPEKQDAMIAEATKKFPKLSVLVAPRLSRPSGRRTAITVGTSRAFMLPLTGSPGKEVLQVHQQGARIDVKATLAADARSVDLTLRPTVVDLNWPGKDDAEPDFSAGEVIESTAAAELTVTVPFGNAVLARLPFSHTKVLGARKGKAARPGAIEIVRTPAPAEGRKTAVYLLVRPRLIQPRNP